jgi:hypothetical protein
VWVQDDVTHTRYYWLAVPKEAAKEKQQITAEVAGQTVRLDGDVPQHSTIRLSDELLDLDQPVHVLVNGHEVYGGRVERCAEVIRESLQERADPRSAATARIVTP